MPGKQFGSDFGRRIKRLRVARGWSQRQLGQMIGMTRSHVSHYEIGFDTHDNPRPQTVERFAEALGVRPCDLLPDTKRGS